MGLRQQQIFFGNASGALTSAQLAQIEFRNPGRLMPGTYPARMLADGEIVPGSGAPLPLELSISQVPSNNAVQVRLEGEVGRTYELDASTDLLHWLIWTNFQNPAGTASFEFSPRGATPLRFFRARLVQ